MKIIQVISQLGNGGAEKLVVELSNELEKDNQITIISFKKIEEWMFFPKKIKDSVELIELNKKKGFDISIIFKLFKIIRDKKPSVIHIHLESTFRYFMLIIPLFQNIKFIYTLHNTFKIFEKTFKRYSKFWFFKRIEFVCLSDSIKNQFISIYPNLKFTTISNGIDRPKLSKNIQKVQEEVSQYKDDSQTKIFIFVGRLTFAKNISLLLEVFYKLQSKNIKLLIIGNDVSKNQEFLSLIQKYNGNNIFYLGSKENVQDYMKYSDALILTSKHEGLPLVVLEAFSLGLPIISTPVGGMVNVIKNGENGFLSKDITLQSILEIIKILLQIDPKNGKKIIENNIKIFDKNFSITLCSNNYISLYKGK